MGRKMCVLAIAVIACLTAGGSIAVAQDNSDIQKQIDDLKKQKELIDAKKARVDSEIALAASELALRQGNDTTAQNLKNVQDAKALADAQKQLADSATAAFIAKNVGTVTAGPYTGSVDVKEKTGTVEAALLASRAVKECATKIAARVSPKTTAAAKIYIFKAADFPNFQRLISYRFRRELLKQAFDSAGIKKTTAAPGLESVAVPAVVSAGLDAFSKILGFFKTDSTVGGIDAALNESVVLFTVAGAISGKQVLLPSIYNPAQTKDAATAIAKDLRDLIDLRALAAAAAKDRSDKIAAAQKAVTDAKDDPTKKTSQAIVDALKPGLDQLNGVIALYDAFIASLTTADANGIVPLTLITQEAAIDGVLADDTPVLLLRLETSGGGYLVKKNLWTGLGTMPLYHMGGAAVSYVLLGGKVGNVLSADVIPVYGDFIRTDNLRATLNK